LKAGGTLTCLFIAYYTLITGEIKYIGLYPDNSSNTLLFFKAIWIT